MSRTSDSSRPARDAVPQPLNDEEMQRLQALLDELPAPLEPLDLSMLDGFLCGVLAQPRSVPVSRWMPLVLDVEGRMPPARFDAAPLRALILRRHAELGVLIDRRQWFDPWIFELSGSGAGAGARPQEPEDGGQSGVSDAALPWASGFAMALEAFPGLLHMDSPALTEPLALVYQHVDLHGLEDADELMQEIELLEPPADLGEAVEALVRATLLLADVGRPQPAAGALKKGRPNRASKPPRR
jgi:uncharacterized protein